MPGRSLQVIWPARVRARSRTNERPGRAPRASAGISQDRPALARCRGARGDDGTREE
jgi:hypothetical protein